MLEIRSSNPPVVTGIYDQIILEHDTIAENQLKVKIKVTWKFGRTTSAAKQLRFLLIEIGVKLV